MIDLHSHLLPGLDDGPKTLQESLFLAHSAAKEGIEIIYATPHHLRAPFDNGRDKVIEAVVQFNIHLRKAGIPLQVRAGQEIRVCPELIQEAYSGQLLPLEGTSYVLLELPSSSIPDFLEDTLHELAVLGWTPILAHPERNREIADNPELLRPLVESGALCQITSHSLTGVFGTRTELAALNICRKGLAHFIASDAHDAVKRPFQLRAAYEKVEKRLGTSWKSTYIENARKLAAGQQIDNISPIARSMSMSKLFGWMARAK
ncbi:tyrosine-protein phosphatase [Cohnella abietis]|uniref:Tyrosine-protein phosphatase n=1 Tax=Cohnella abietis TaxID=2507935 RepID=A0A3T1D1V3_9BACL|nr:CpsB/CapC family capsule biosynthesis tyrosine phosphatase [Cohnella abietis]BBI32087.1 tyrosine protein phosphatase [Cohnella abietis]